MKAKLIILAILSSTLFFPAYAQKKKKKKDTDTTEVGESDYFKKIFRNEDAVYVPNIKTVTLYPANREVDDPILLFGGKDRLVLGFDDLEGDIKTYSYTLIHCNADWKESGLMQSEYLDGFYDEQINSYASSFNTIQKYTHYELFFPTESVRPTKTGNYILKVYLDNDPEKFVLSKRFMIADNRLSIDANINKSTVIEDMNLKHEVDFIIDQSSYKINNPLTDLKVVVLQNGRWDNAITGIVPQYINGNQLIYDYSDQIVFPAGNEFRYFNTNSTHVKSERIRDLVTDSSGTSYTLFPEPNRLKSKYLYYREANGKFKIDYAFSKRPELEADYVKVNFFYPTYTTFEKGNVYIFGGLSYWQYLPEFKLNYNSERSGYEGTVILKQGYYNFMLTFLPDGQFTGDASLLEGSYYDTENEYTILVYYRPAGSTYDALIGLRKIHSPY